MTPQVAVVIVSWNVCEYTLVCVRALMNESIEKEIIVVDNASSDDTVAALQKEFPSIQIIANESNRGFAAAVNQGVAVTTAPIILVLNPDTKIVAGTLWQFVKKFETTNAAILGPSLVNEKGDAIPSIRANPNWWSQVFILLKWHHIFPQLLSKYFQRDFDYTKEQLVDQIMGSAMAIRRDAYNEMHGFDEHFFIWFEEVDFCKRARDAGMKIIYTPEIVVTDFAGKSFMQVQPTTRAYYFTDSLNYYAKKHWSTWQQLLIRFAGWLHRALSYGVQAVKLKPQPRPR